MASDNTRTQYPEGPDAARRFDDTLSRVMKVWKEERAKREAAYQKSSQSRKETPHGAPNAPISPYSFH